LDRQFALQELAGCWLFDFSLSLDGYKVVVNGVWFYASKRPVLELVNGRQKACTFRTIG